MKKDPLLLGVIGNPVDHSLSPQLFALIEKKLKVPLLYKKIKLEDHELPLAFHLFRQMGFAGVNVTIPHKEKLFPFLSEATKEAKEIGAVNVITFGKHTKGYNSDYFGFLAVIEESKLNLKGKTVLLYGAGGVARAVVYGLKKLGAKKLIIANRSADRALTLRDQFQGPKFKVEVIGLDDISSVKEEVSLFINTLPLFKEIGKVTDFPFDLPPLLSADALALDVVYAKKKTPFLTKALKKVKKGEDGLGLLIYQALFAYEFFTAKKIPLKKSILKQNLLGQLRKG